MDEYLEANGFHLHKTLSDEEKDKILLGAFSLAWMSKVFPEMHKDSYEAIVQSQPENLFQD